MDYTADAQFQARREALEAMIAALALPGARCDDAVALVRRQLGWNNLQGHARALVPLALWFALRHRPLLRTVRNRTSLRVEMNRGSAEARDDVWLDVQQELRADLAAQGNDIVSIGPQANSPSTARAIARTYLSADYGGRHALGGAGNTVLKRTLKILAHTLMF